MASLLSYAILGMALLACTGRALGSSNCGIQASDIQSELCEIRDKVSALETAFSTIAKLQTDVANLWHAIQSQTAKIIQHDTALKTSANTVQQITDMKKTVAELKNKTFSLEAKCTACANHVDHCTSSPCKNNGSCVSLDDGYYCVCVGNYTGQHCDQYDPCFDKQPCQNGGKCFNSPIGYMCQCSQGYGGSNCDIILNPCDSQPCGHGLCAPFNNTYTCLCDAGYHGKTCNETSIQTTGESVSPITTTSPKGPCENSAPCNEPSKCVNHGQDNYTCECPETQKTKNDPCIRPYYLLPYGFCCIKDICKNSDPDCFSPPSGVTSENTGTQTETIYSSTNPASTTPSPSDTVSMSSSYTEETQTTTQATNSANTAPSISTTSMSAQTVSNFDNTSPFQSSTSSVLASFSTTLSQTASTLSSNPVSIQTTTVSSNSRTMTSPLPPSIMSSISAETQTTTLAKNVTSTAKTLGPCDQGSPCNEPSKCVDDGNGNYTCVCPETLQTINDKCLQPFYLQPYGFCCVKDNCKNSEPDCLSTSPPVISQNNSLPSASTSSTVGTMKISQTTAPQSQTSTANALISQGSTNTHTNLSPVSSINTSHMFSTSKGPGQCDSSPCNDPAQCVDNGNGNYTCACPETLATQADPCLVPYYLQPYGFCCSLNTCNNTGPDCSSSPPIAGSVTSDGTTSVPTTVSPSHSNPCDSSPCNDPAQCVDNGNGNYTCACPETLATQADPCLVPYYLQPYGFCCSLNTCNNTGPDCSSSSPIVGSITSDSTTSSVPVTVSISTSGPCDSSPCNDPAQCVDNGNGNYTCACPETLATQADPCLVPYYLQPYGFCCSLNMCNNTGPDCSSSSPIVATSGPCDISPCNEPAKCKDTGNGNYTCECPPTQKTLSDPCLEPYYLMPYGFCCTKDTCKNTDPDCL